MNFRQYKSLAKVLSDYWTTYGGWCSFISSPFLHLSILFTFVCFPLWINGRWVSVAISVVPAMLGFSLAAYTLSLGIGGDGFQKFFASRRSNDRPSMLSLVSASFMHFILAQIVAILFVLVKLSHWGAFIFARHYLWFGLPKPIVADSLRIMSVLLGFFGVLAMVYACLVGVAAMFRVFRISKSLGVYAEMRKKQEVANGRDSSETK